MVRRKSTEKVETEKDQTADIPPKDQSVNSTITPKPFVDPSDEDDDQPDDHSVDDGDDDWTPSKEPSAVTPRMSTRLKRSLQPSSLSEFFCEPQKKGQKRLSHARTTGRSPIEDRVQASTDASTTPRPLPISAARRKSTNAGESTVNSENSGSQGADKATTPAEIVPAQSTKSAVPTPPTQPAVAAALAAPPAPALGAIPAVFSIPPISAVAVVPGNRPKRNSRKGRKEFPLTGQGDKYEGDGLANAVSVLATPAVTATPAVPATPVTPVVSATPAVPATPAVLAPSVVANIPVVATIPIVPAALDKPSDLSGTNAETENLNDPKQRQIHESDAGASNALEASDQAAPETAILPQNAPDIEAVNILDDDEDADALPNIVAPVDDVDDDGGELPDIVEVENAAPSSSTVFTRPSLEQPPPVAKKPKAARAKRPSTAATKQKQKLPVVPETAEMSSLSLKLSALQKEDLIDIIKRAVYFGKAPSMSSLENDLPKPNVKEFAKEIKRLKSAVMRAVPKNFYGSNRDHYSFLRCQPALNEFAKAASEQISILGKLEDWNGILEYALTAGCSIMDLPTWDREGDNYHETRVTGQLMALLGRAVPRLSFSPSRAQALLLEIEDKRASNYLSVVVKILEKLI